MPKRTWCADLKMSPGSICAIVCVARVSVVAGAMAAGDGASIEVGGEGRPNLPRQARRLALGASMVSDGCLCPGLCHATVHCVSAR